MAAVDGIKKRQIANSDMDLGASDSMWYTPKATYCPQMLLPAESVGSDLWEGLRDHASAAVGIQFAPPLEEINARRMALHTQESEGRKSAIQRCVAHRSENNVPGRKCALAIIEWANANLPMSLASKTIWRLLLPSTAFHRPMRGVP